MAIDLTGGVPTWIEQGPGPELNGSAVLPAAQMNQVSGALQSIAVNPNDPTQIVAGTVNGGVWRTTNADPTNPTAITWTPISDQLASLAIGTVAYDPRDATGNTFYAGTGVFSNSFNTGGPAIGLYKTTDAGATWTLLGQATLTGHRIKAISQTGATFLLGAVDGSGISQGADRDYANLGGGLFRSIDDGVTFNQVLPASGLPAGAVPSIVGDPTNDQRFFAAVAGQGVFRSDDAGATWNTFSTGLTSNVGSSDIELAVQNVGVVPRLFAGVSTGSTLNGVFTTTNLAGAGNWTALAAPPAAFNAGGPFTEKFQIEADPVTDNVVYIDGESGGDRIFRFNPAGAGSWVLINNAGTANGTDPHPDSHDLKFLGTNVLLESDDGGIYVLRDPLNAAANDWNTFQGNLKTSEIYWTEYDSTNNVLFSGLQDNGSPHQNSPGNFTWTRQVGGDGQFQAVDATSAGTDVLRYSLGNNYAGFHRLTFNNANVLQTDVDVGLRSSFAAADRSGLNAADQAFTKFDFQPYVLNAVDPRLMLLGYNGVYEDADPAAANGLAGDVITDITSNLAGITGKLYSLAYGGVRGGTGFTNVAFVGTRNGEVFFRGEAGAAFTNISDGGVGEIPSTNSDVNSIALNPDDWRRVYVVKNNQVFFTPDVTDLTNNPFQIIGGGALDNLGISTTQLRTVEVVRIGTDVVPLVGSLNGTFRLQSPGVWTELGTNLPNAVVQQLSYDLTDDVLVASTFGRGAWTVSNFSTVANDAAVLNVCGDEDFVNQDDVILLVRDSGNPLLLDVFINGVLQAPVVPIAVLSQINVFGVGGNDNLFVDSTNGLINVPLGIRYDGDGKCPTIPVNDGPDDEGDGAGYDRGFDRLTLLQTGGPTHISTSYAVGPQIGSGTYQTLGAGGGNAQTIFFEELEPIVDVVPVTNFTITATPESNAITSTAGPNSGIVSVLNPAGDLTAQVTIDNYESVEFSNKADVTINAGSGDDHVVVNNAVSSTSLVSLTVNGGEGNDLIEFLAVPAVAVGGFQQYFASGNAASDVIDARFVAVNTPGILSGNEGNDSVTGGQGNDLLSGDAGDDTLAGGDPAITPVIGNNTYIGDVGFDTLLILGTLANDTISVNQTGATAITSTVNANASTEAIGSTIEQVNIQARQGNDLVRVQLADGLITNVQRYSVAGDAPNASDRLIVTDEGVGDLVLVRQGADSRSGRVSVAPGAVVPPPEIVYEGIERLDVLPIDPVTGLTGTPPGGQVKVFHNDPFEYNDNRLTAATLARVPESPTKPTIDPGGLADPFGDGSAVPGDEDWYEFRPQHTGTFRVKILFDTLLTVASGRPGLPGAGDLNLDIYDANGVLIVSGVAASGGKAADFAATNDPAFPEFNRIFVRVRGASTSSINVYDFDDLAGLATSNPGVGNIDIFGPQVTDVTINDLTTAQYNLFGQKPSNAAQGPTPLVTSLLIRFQDLPARVAGFLYPALETGLTEDEARGLFEVVGDANGLVAIQNVIITNPLAPVVVGAVPEATIRLVFAQPLPDDRFTLTIHDSLRDPAGNLLDGESNADEPQVTPFFPSGDGFAGGDFVARFTVDSVAELGATASGSVYVDTNGNNQFDPTNTDFTNRDITYLMGFTSDNVFAGNFVKAANGVADGFDKLAAYGKVGTAFRWIADVNNDGVITTGIDINVVQPLVAGVTTVNGMPAAGNFDNNATNGDEVVLKVGNVWLLDTDHDFKVNLKLAGTNMVGLPIVGDFDGDGKDDLGAWADNKFSLNLSTLGAIDGTTDVSFTFGFTSTRERPVAADFNGDGIDDIGLWVPDRAGVAPHESAEWYLLLSTPQQTVPQRAFADSGLLINGFINFKPTPFGPDRYAQFGDEFGLPVVGNFDPPLTSAIDSGANTNLNDPLDVNNDGEISPLDALLVINLLNAGQTHLEEPVYSRAPFVDINNDGEVSPLDALLVINWLNAQPAQTPNPPADSGEGEAAVVADAYFSQIESQSSIAANILASVTSERSHRIRRRS